MSTALARYVVRSVRWQPMLLAIAMGASAAVGTRTVTGRWEPPALLFCVTAMAAAVGVAMDDPAAESLAGVPTRLWRRSGRAAAVVVVPATTTWGTLALSARGLPVIGELTLMGAVLCLVGLAAGTAARRRWGPRSAGLVAAPTVALVALAAVGAPEPWSLAPGQPGMAARWSLVGGVAVAALTCSLLDPARRPRGGRPLTAAGGRRRPVGG